MKRGFVARGSTCPGLALAGLFMIQLILTGQQVQNPSAPEKKQIPKPEFLHTRRYLKGIARLFRQSTGEAVAFCLGSTEG